MKKIELTRGFIAFVDDEDFERINSFNWCIAKTKRSVYAVRGVSYSNNVYMHHEVLRVKPDKIWPLQVDHIDRNPLNNQKSNLRIVSRSANLRNTWRSDKSGVCFYRWTGKWMAYRYKDRRIHLGYFNTQAEARKAVEDYNNEHFK